MYYLREYAFYGRRGGVTRSGWQVVSPDEVVVYSGGKKTAKRLCDKLNEKAAEDEGGGEK